MHISPVLLENESVLLRPMTEADFDTLFVIANHPQVHTWVKAWDYQDSLASDRWFQQALDEGKKGNQIPLVTIDKATGQLIGSTRFTSIQRQNRTLEIGYTFITPEFQRSHINTNAKYLMLQHAFETWGAIRVQLITHEHNQKSRNAIARIGGTFEGILRNQKILNDGSYRNTAVFSIIESEWPQVEQQLRSKIEKTYV